MIRVCNKMAFFENKEIKNRKAELSLRPEDPAAHFNLGTARSEEHTSELQSQ